MCEATSAGVPGGLPVGGGIWLGLEKWTACPWRGTVWGRKQCPGLRTQGREEPVLRPPGLLTASSQDRGGEVREAGTLFPEAALEQVPVG